MFTGVSGLLNNGEAMNVIGNNISNVNTVGFKYGRTLFSDMLSSNIGNNSQIGRGMQLQKVENIFGQGSFENTENISDLAIQGNSFFALKSPTSVAPVAAQNSAFLSRAGAFHVDNSLTLVNPDGYQVLDTSGNPIRFSDNAAATTAAAVTYNTGGTAGTAITDLGTDNGNAQTAVTAMAAGPAQDAAQALVDAAVAAATAADAANTTFTATPSPANAAAVASAVATAALATQAAVAAAGSTYNAGPSVTAAATEYNLVATEEGKAFAKIIKIEPNGLISYLGKDGMSTFYYNTSGAAGLPATTANSAVVQRLAVVSAMDVTGLEKAGNSLFRATTTSGVATSAFSLAANTPNGSSEKVLSNSLEQSNVDMASQFVKMIITQRAYSANSKTITTTDEMTQEVLNLKR
jgi:flagellar hook protein FlgE